MNTYYPSVRDRGGVLEQTRCTGALGTLLNLKSASPFSETAVAFDCSVRPGNSGSPVVNSQGEVVGIAQAFLLEGYNQLLQANFLQYSQTLPPTLPPHVLFTNLACVPDPVTKQYAITECEGAMGLNLFSCLDRSDPGLATGLTQTYEPSKQKLPPIFLYTKTQDIKSGSMTAIPHFVVPKKAVGSTYEDYVRKSGLVYGFRTEKIDTLVPLDLAVKGRLKFDSYYRVVLPIVFAGETSGERRIELEKDGEVWTGNISSRKELFGIGHWQTEKTISLRDCTDRGLANGNVELARLETGEIVNEVRATEIANLAKSATPALSPYCAH